MYNALPYNIFAFKISLFYLFCQGFSNVFMFQAPEFDPDAKIYFGFCEVLNSLDVIFEQ